MKEITRRNFLKKSVAATVAAGMLPVLGNAGELMMSGEEPGIGGRGRRRCCGIRAKRILLISYDGICREGFLKALKSATSLTKCYRLKRNVLLIRNPPIQSARPFQCAYHPLTP